VARVASAGGRHAKNLPELIRVAVRLVSAES
jgi:hypothetical protein